ncbi:MAG: WG repeat-containing protein [Saprospiraceae bacterium]
MKTNIFLLTMLLFAFGEQPQMPLFSESINPKDAVLILPEFRSAGDFSEGLAAVRINGFYGYIDTKGAVVIQPEFRSAGDFSEGLAAVRINGFYGYIDTKGIVVIPPQFDFATAFSEGYAVVFREGKPFFINKTGQIPFACDFARLASFENGRAMVRTQSGQMGMVDKQGKLVVDTAYFYIEKTEPGLFVVRSRSKTGNTQEGIIDSRGNSIIPLGKFRNIGSFVDGYVQVSTDYTPADTTEESSLAVFIDARGEIVFERKESKKNGWLGDDSYNKIMTIRLYKHWIPEEEGVLYTTEKSYEGYVNSKGQIVLNDTLIKSVIPFSNQRGFIQNMEDQWFLIDETMQKVTEQAFLSVWGFDKGYAFVEIKGKPGYGMINREGQWVIPPQFHEIHNSGIVDDYFFFGQESYTEDYGYEVLYGVCDLLGQVLIEAVLQDFDPEGFKNGLLKVQMDGKMAYLNRAGDVIWQEKKDNFVEELNIDFMNRGYFYAYSELDIHDLYNTEQQLNVPQKISKNQGFPENQLSVIIKTDEPALIDKKWIGYKLYVANTTHKNIEFNAQDGRIYMKLQARDANGKWRDIEYLPSSWCGNSYHIQSLKKNQYWSFSIPKYNGAIKTQIRASLTYNASTSKSEERRNDNTITIYSNEFEGSINPGQFWRKKDYYPGSIMDPYDD